MASLKPFQFFGSRLSLCLVARQIACPLTFSMAGTAKGTGFDPSPSGDGERHRRQHVGGVVFLVQVLSRTTAQPAVFTTSTFRPCFS